MVIDKEQLNKFAKECGVKFLVLCGSYAQGTVRDDSDVDVAVYFDSPKSIFHDFGNYSNFINRLQNIIQFGGTVDLIDLKDANILLRYEVTAKGKFLFGDETEYAQYKAFAFREYLDATSLFELESNLIQKRQKLLKEAII